jgi:DNA replication protein DnaC
VKASSEIQIPQIGEKTELLDCEKHGGYAGKVHTIFGKEFRTGCRLCEEENKLTEIEKEKQRVRKLKSDRVNYLFGASAIPLRFKTRTFENYTALNKESEKALSITKQYAEKFESRLKTGGGLIFCGKPGTGKTHLSCAIANHIIGEHGHSALFTSVLSMMRRVKETYSRTSEKTEREVIDSFTQPDLLIIDEVGVQFGSDAEKLILFEIINNRYENMQPTIIISNLALSELKSFVGDRVIDRMKEGGGALISFDWDSYRGK